MSLAKKNAFAGALLVAVVVAVTLVAAVTTHAGTRAPRFPQSGVARSSATGYVATQFSTARSSRTQPGTPRVANLPELLTAGKLKPVNREVTKLQGSPDGVHVSEKQGPGVVWLEGSEFAEGTIELDVRGRDVPQRSFVGVAFHGKDDKTYEAVYVRPFNFRSNDPTNHRHAVQYMALPDYDWPRLRKEFANEFEGAVDQSVVPTDWVPLRVVVKGARLQVYVGAAKAPALEARKLGQSDRGQIGLWVGNNSDGDFANLRLTPAK